MESVNILFYNTMWGSPLELSLKNLPTGCSITTDRKELRKAHAVFYLPDNGTWTMRSLSRKNKYG